MRILDVLSDTPWAIIPDKKVEIDSIYLAHTRREKVDFDAIERKIGGPLNNQPKGYEIQRGVAILPVEGVIAKRMSLFTRISGGVSTSYLQNDFRQALEDPAVKAIVLHVDSPGGAVDGTQELASLIFQNRGKKPVVALADGLMASAAYWIGAAADQILVTSDTTQVGSIGVVATHVDVSKAEEQMGIKTTEITAGRFKRIASQYAPLSQEGRASIQDHVDTLYSVFLSDVAKFRGGTPEDVHERMADGRIFIGKAAIDAGLVDGVSTLSELIDRLASGEAPSKISPRRAGAAVVRADAEDLNAEGGASSEPTNTNQEKPMDKEQFKAEHPELYEAVLAEGEANCKTKFDKELVEQGAAAERARIQGCLDAALPGHEALARELAFDGKTTPGDAALKINAAEREKKVKVHTNLKADAPNPAQASQDTDEPKADADAPVEDRAKAEWDKDSKLRAEFGGNFDAFVAFKRAEESGRARVFTK